MLPERLSRSRTPSHTSENQPRRWSRCKLALETLEERTLLDAGFFDPSFGVNGLVTTELTSATISVQPDGKIVALGPSAARPFLFKGVALRFLPTGVLDPTFGNGGRVITNFASPQTGALQSDGKILFMRNGLTVARYNADGSRDGTFNAGLITFPSQTPETSEPLATGLTADADGKIIVTGYCPTAALFSSAVMARLTPSGSLDPSFGSGGKVGSCPFFFAQKGSDSARFLARPDGGILELHSGQHYLAPPHRFVTRYSAAGTPDTTFRMVNMIEWGLDSALLFQPDGRLLVAATDGRLARFNPDGSPDAGFGTNGRAGGTFEGLSSPRGVVVQPDGKLVVVGLPFGASIPQPPTSFTLTRYLPDGRPDLGFGIAGRDIEPAGPEGLLPYTIIPLADGSFLTQDNAARLGRFVLAPSTRTANQRYVSQLYQLLLRRDADPGGFTHFVGLLDQGLASRIQVAGQMVSSVEYKGGVVRDLYRSILARNADPAGLRAFTDRLVGGGTIAEVKAALFGSEEYSRKFGSPVTNDNWLRGMYNVLFGRDIDASGHQFFGAALAAGVSRYAVALQLLNSTEGLQATVRGYYRQFLRRDADPGGLAHFVTYLQVGMTPPTQPPVTSGSGAVIAAVRVETREEELAAFLLGSAEFNARF